MKSRLPIRFAALCAALLLIVARAAAQELTVNVSDEYGGYYRPNDWYPVVVSIQNQAGRAGDRTADFVGRVSVESDSYGEREGSYDFVREVEVPSGAILRFTTFVKLRENPANPPMVVVRAASGKMIHSAPLNVQALSLTQLLLVTVSEEARNYYFPRHPAPAANRPLQRAFVSPRNLPESWAAYDPVDVLVFPGWPDTRVVERNVQALQDWVAMGGTLVFLGGSRSPSYQNPTADELLPVTTSGSRRCRIDAKLGRLVPAAEGEEIAPQDAVLVSDAVPKPGAEVIFDASGGAGEPIPLLVRKPHGRGQIVFLGADLESASPAFSAMVAPSWFAVMPVNNVVDWRWAFAEQLGKATAVVTRRAGRPPNVVIVILICVMYTLAVGPVNFFMLSKMGRIQLAWFTVPAIVFVFSGLIYAFGTLTKGGDSIAREITVLHGVEDQPVFEERGSVSVFVPGSDDFEFRPKERAHTVADNDRWHEHPEVLAEVRYMLADTSAGGGFVFGGGNPAIESTDDNAFVRSWPLRTFDTARFEVRGPRELAGGIDADLVYGSTRVPRRTVWIEGTIANNTGIDFYESALVFGSAVKPLGPFDSGDTRTLTPKTGDYPIDSLGGSEKFAKPNGPGPITDIGTSLPSLQVNARSEQDSDFNRMNARNVVNAILNPPMSGDLVPPMRGKLLFVGFAEDKDLTVHTNLERDTGTRSIVMICELNPVPAPGPFYVPSELVQVNLQDYPEQSGFSIDSENGRQGISMLFDSEATFTTELPFRHPSVFPAAMTKAVPDPAGYDPALQKFTVGAWRLDANNAWIELSGESGIPRTSGPPAMTPYSGRGWVTIEYSRTEEGKKQQGGLGGQMAGAFSNARIDAVGFNVYGVREE